MECYLAIKKEWNTAIFSDMEESRDYHTKWSKAERERQTSNNITYIWEPLKMIQMNLFIKQTHKNCDLSYGYQKGKWRRH